MELIRVDTHHTYQVIREKIITLELKPGEPLDEAKLAQEIDVSQKSVREALKLLVHDHLVEAPPRGLYVAKFDLEDLEQISAIRLHLETFSAREAARKATADDLVVLEALCQEHAEEVEQLLELDHKFHQAIVRAAHNKYLAEALEHYFGLSQRVWYLVLPYIDFLPGAVQNHIELVDAIKASDGQKAEHIMHDHIKGFYTKIIKVLKEEEKKVP